MDFERTTSLPLLEINFQRRNPCCLFVCLFVFCHSTATKTKVLKRYNDPTSSFKHVSYEEEFFAEYLAGPLTAYVSHFGKRKTEKWNARKCETRRPRYNSWGSSRVACVPPLAYARVYARSLVIAEIRDYLQSVWKCIFCLPFTMLENDDKNQVNAKWKRKNTAPMDSKKQLETRFRHPCCWNQTSILNVQSTRNLFSYVQREFIFFFTRNLEPEVQSYHARSLHQFRLWWYVLFLHHATPSIY